MKAREQVAAIQRHGFRERAAIERVLESRGVAPHEMPIEPQLGVTAAEKRFGAERLAKMADGFAQRAARARVVALRPQQRDQRVAAVISARRRDRQVHEDRLPLRLREDRVKEAAVGAEELETPKYLEINHF